jgi:DnaD/phage-associated family protein
MPRIRTIKPEFWLDEELGTVSRDARLLYIGLWNIADDTGVFELKPKKIKVQLLPYDDTTDEQVIGWISELEAIGNIVRFSDNGSNYGLIKSFTKHQVIKRPSSWKYVKDFPRETLFQSPRLPLPPDSPTTHPLPGEPSPTTHPVVENYSPSSGYRKRNSNTEKEKEKEKETIPERDVGETNEAAVFKLYEENIGFLTEITSNEIILALKEYGATWILDAIKTAAVNGVRKWSYVEGVLKRRRETGNNHFGKINTQDRELEILTGGKGVRNANSEV